MIRIPMNSNRGDMITNVNYDLDFDESRIPLLRRETGPSDPITGQLVRDPLTDDREASSQISPARWSFTILSAHAQGVTSSSDAIGGTESERRRQFEGILTNLEGRDSSAQATALTFLIENKNRFRELMVEYLGNVNSLSQIRNAFARILWQSIPIITAEEFLLEKTWITNISSIRGLVGDSLDLTFPAGLNSRRLLRLVGDPRILNSFDEQRIRFPRNSDWRGCVSAIEIDILSNWIVELGRLSAENRGRISSIDLLISSSEMISRSVDEIAANLEGPRQRGYLARYYYTVAVVLASYGYDVEDQQVRDRIWEMSRQQFLRFQREYATIRNPSINYRFPWHVTVADAWLLNKSKEALGIGERRVVGRELSCERPD